MSASTTSGTARPVLRSARPALELFANALKSAPSGVGFAYGDGADRDDHRRRRAARRRTARCRQRTTPAASRLSDDEAVAGEEHDGPLRVLARRLDPRTDAVAAVEEPVAEPAQDLVRERRGRDRLDRLACTSGRRGRTCPASAARRSTTAT